MKTKDDLTRSMDVFLNDLAVLMARHDVEINPLTDGGMDITLGTFDAWLSVTVSDDQLTDKIVRKAIEGETDPDENGDTGSVWTYGPPVKK